MKACNCHINGNWRAGTSPTPTAAPIDTQIAASSSMARFQLLQSQISNLKSSISNLKSQILSASSSTTCRMKSPVCFSLTYSS